MSLLDDADDIGRSPRPGLGLVVLRALFERAKDVLEGRVPPHARLDEEKKDSLRELRRHIENLGGAAGALGIELIRQHIKELRSKLTRRRQQQRNRHSVALRRRRPSPVQVRRFVIQHEIREGDDRGAAAAAARHFGESRHAISQLMHQADQQWGSLLMLQITVKGVEQVLAEDVRAGSGIASHLDAAVQLRMDIEKLLRKLSPRR